MIIKTCLAGLVVAGVLILGLAARSGTVLAHDCNDPSHGSPYGYGYYHDGGHNDCPTPQPAPTSARKPYYAPTQAAPSPAATSGVASALQPAPTPRGAAAGGLSPQPPAVRGPEAARLAPPEASRVAATSNGSGISGLVLALGAVAVVALLTLIRAGFRARRRLGDGVDASWPGA